MSRTTAVTAGAPLAASPAAAGAPSSKWLGLCLLLSVVAGALLGLGFLTRPERALYAYLTAYAWVMSIVLGSLAFVMITHAASAVWPVALRRPAEATAAAMPLLLLLLLPVVFGVHALYPWAHPERYSEHVRELLEHRGSYMNPTFFAVRTLGFVALWSVVALALRRGSLAMDDGERAQQQVRRLQAISYAGLPLVGLSAAFFGFDTLMSLSPQWFSTMFGVNWIAICLLAGVCFLLLPASWALRSDPAIALASSHFHALSRLTFAFLIFLAYTVFFQYMLMWIADLPSEVQWYLRRWQGWYKAVALFLVFGHFAVPFFALLSYRLKRSPRPLTAVACWLLAAQYLHLHWIVTPESQEPGLDWLDVVAVIALGAFTAAFGLWLQRRRAPAAIGDPRYAAALRYRSR